jgi:hypothetical protein
MLYETYDGEMVDGDLVDVLKRRYIENGMPKEWAEQWALRDLKLSFGDVLDERAALWKSPFDLREGKR